MSAPALERPLHVTAALRHANTSVVDGPVAAGLTLQHAHVPASGGAFVFYLLDPPHAPIQIGRLDIVGPVSPRISSLEVYVELPTRALALLRATSSPTVRIVQTRHGGAPLAVGGVELHT
jgi:hypothetical protein